MSYFLHFVQEICLHTSLNKCLTGLPWWLSGEDRASAGHAGSIPGPGRPHMLSNQAQAPQLLSPCSEAQGATATGPRAPHSPRHNKRSPHNENARQPERSPRCMEDPAQPKMLNKCQVRDVYSLPQSLKMWGFLSW